MIKEEYMKRAIELAKRATGFTNPNPLVGAVIVKDDRIIGEGYHEKCGQLHAERNAFASLKESAKGATLYVTLEPCCHYGKTPPCTEAIVENEIAKVVIGSRDPNPLVAGKGVSFLRAHGIEVIEDFMRAECDRINPVFFHYITAKMPYVVLKYAMTADGKIATRTGDSKWITSEASRMRVQHMRHRYMGILAGIGTVLADDPMLNVRVDGLKSPIRIICDSHLRIPLDSQIVKSADRYKTIVACTSADEKKRDELTKRGIIVEVIPTSDKNVISKEQDQKVDMRSLLQRLGEMGIDSILVEGGGNINDSLLQEGLINQVEVFVGPKLFGGANAKSPMEGKGVSMVADAPTFYLDEIERIGDDVHITYMRK